MEPAFSLLRLGVGGRLAAVSVLVIVLWMLVAWALAI